MAQKWIFPMLSLSVKVNYCTQYGQDEVPHESVKPNVAFAWLYEICRDILTTFRKKGPPTKSKSLKIKVFLRSNPTATMSLAFLRANSCVCSTLSSCLNKNFSSSDTTFQPTILVEEKRVRPVSWITSGTSKTSCNHLHSMRTRV